MKGIAAFALPAASLLAIGCCPTPACPVQPPAPAPDAPLLEGTFRRVQRHVWCVSTTPTVDVFEQTDGDRVLIVRDRQEMRTEPEIAVIRYREVEPHVLRAVAMTCEGEVEVVREVNAVAEAIDYPEGAAGDPRREEAP